MTPRGCRGGREVADHRVTRELTSDQHPPDVWASASSSSSVSSTDDDSCGRTQSRLRDPPGTKRSANAIRAAGSTGTVERGHHLDRLRERLTGRRVPVVEHPEAERLGEGRWRPELTGVVAQPVGISEARDREAVPRLPVGDGVVAREVAARLGTHVGAPAQHLGGEVEGQQLPRPPEQVDRDQGSSPMA